MDIGELAKFRMGIEVTGDAKASVSMTTPIMKNAGGEIGYSSVKEVYSGVYNNVFIATNRGSRSSTTLAGCGIELLAPTADTGECFIVWANQDNDATNEPSDIILSALPTGAWTWGATVTSTAHKAQGTVATEYGALWMTNKSTNNADPGAAIWTAATTDSTANKLLNFARSDGGATAGAIGCDGAGGAQFTTYSDERLKENFKQAEAQLPKILSMIIQRYDLKNGSKNCIGSTAQNLEKIYPECVAIDESTEEKYLQVGGWGQTEYKLAKAIQELNAKIEALESKLA